MWWPITVNCPIICGPLKEGDYVLYNKPVITTWFIVYGHKHPEIKTYNLQINIIVIVSLLKCANVLIHNKNVPA